MYYRNTKKPTRAKKIRGPAMNKPTEKRAGCHFNLPSDVVFLFSEIALAARILGKHALKLLFGEVGPERIAKNQFAVRGFP